MADQEPEIVTGRPAEPHDEGGESVNRPAKLLRIGSMLRELLEEVRRASPDEPGRRRLREIYDKALAELKAGLSDELQHELEAFAVPLDESSSESEIRIAKAQILGWLEGLFQGIQAAMFAQQIEARNQLASQMRQRGLPPGPAAPGQYL